MKRPRIISAIVKTSSNPKRIKTRKKVSHETASLLPSFKYTDRGISII